jgi:hypothetical protein
LSPGTVTGGVTDSNFMKLGEQQPDHDRLAAD